MAGEGVWDDGDGSGMTWEGVWDDGDGGIPAFAGMTWVSAGMTWEGRE